MVDAAAYEFADTNKFLEAGAASSASQMVWLEHQHLFNSCLCLQRKMWRDLMYGAGMTCCCCPQVDFSSKIAH